MGVSLTEDVRRLLGPLVEFSNSNSVRLRLRRIFGGDDVVVVVEADDEIDRKEDEQRCAAFAANDLIKRDRTNSRFADTDTDIDDSLRPAAAA